MTLADLDSRIQRLEAALQHTIRAGTVSATYPERCTVKVQFADADGMTSMELPVLQKSTLKDKNYNVPDVGEQVACMFQGHGQENGFVVGCAYSKQDKAPVNSQDKYYQSFADGTTMEYDRNSSTLTIKTVGDIHIEAEGEVTIIGRNIHLNP